GSAGFSSTGFYSSVLPGSVPRTLNLEPWRTSRNPGELNPVEPCGTWWNRAEPKLRACATYGLRTVPEGVSARLTSGRRILYYPVPGFPHQVRSSASGGAYVPPDPGRAVRARHSWAPASRA